MLILQNQDAQTPQGHPVGSGEVWGSHWIMEAPGNIEEGGGEGEGPTGRLPEAGLKSRPLSYSHPLHSKMLLVTLRWQVVTHKL